MKKTIKNLSIIFVAVIATLSFGVIASLGLSNRNNSVSEITEEESTETIAQAVALNTNSISTLNSSSTKYYTIGTKDQLNNLRTLSKSSTLSGYTFIITQNIDGVNWTDGIGSSTYKFAGTLISMPGKQFNITAKIDTSQTGGTYTYMLQSHYYTKPNNKYGFINYANGAKIFNLNFNITLVQQVRDRDSGTVFYGGLVAEATSSTFKHCTVTTNVTSPDVHFYYGEGGLFAYKLSNCKISYCTVNKGGSFLSGMDTFKKKAEWGDFARRASECSSSTFVECKGTTISKSTYKKLYATYSSGQNGVGNNYGYTNFYKINVYVNGDCVLKNYYYIGSFNYILDGNKYVMKGTSIKTYTSRYSTIENSSTDIIDAMINSTSDTINIYTTGTYAAKLQFSGFTSVKVGTGDTEYKNSYIYLLSNGDLYPNETLTNQFSSNTLKVTIPDGYNLTGVSRYFNYTHVSGNTYNLTYKSGSLTSIPSSVSTISPTLTGKDYTITITSNLPSTAVGTTVCTTQQTARYNTTTKLSPSSTTGHEFLGYYTDATGGTQITDKNGNFIKNVSGYTDSNGKWNRTSGVTLFAHWGNPITVTVTIKDGSTTVATKQVTYGSTSMDTYSVTGYDFLGYYMLPSGSFTPGNKKVTDSDGKFKNNVGSGLFNYIGEKLVETISLTNSEGKWICTSDVTIYASMRLKKFQITVNNVAPPTKLSTDIYGQFGFMESNHLYGTITERDIFYLSTTYKNYYNLPGHTCTGLYTAATGGELVVDTNGNMRANVSGYTDSYGRWIRLSDTTLYARYVANEYAINFSYPKPETALTNINNTHVPVQITHGTTAENLSSIPSLAGHTFLGYYLGDEQIFDADGHVVANNSLLTDGKWNLRDNVTLTAKWENNTYHITLRATNPSSNPSIALSDASDIVIDAKYGEVLTIDGNVDFHSTNFGYTLLGYYYNNVKNINSNKSILNDSSIVNGAGKLKITDDIVLTASFKANLIMFVFDNDSYNLNTNIKSKLNSIIFAHFDSNDFGMVTNYDAQTISLSNLRESDIKGNLQLTAVTGETLSNLAFVPNNNKLVRFGTNGGKLYYPVDNSFANADVYNSDIVSVVPTYELKSIELAKTVTLDGYDVNLSYIDTIYESETQKYIVYASGANVYRRNVALNDNLLASFSYNVTGYTLIGFSNTQLAYDLSRTDEWNLSRTDVVIKVEGGNSLVAVNGKKINSVVYPILKPNTYNVAKYHQFIPNVNVLTQTGYTFGGYTYQNELVFDADGKTIKNTAIADASGRYILADDVVLDEVWTANTYTIKLNDNWSVVGGSDAEITFEGTYDTVYTTVLGEGDSVPSRFGLTFAGYYTARSGGDQIVQASGVFNTDNALLDAEGKWKCTAPLTLYAHWTPQTYDVLYRNIDGTGTSATISESGVSFDITDFMAKSTAVKGDSAYAGYTLAGFVIYDTNTIVVDFINNTCNLSVLSEDAISDNKIVLDAVWQADSDTEYKYAYYLMDVPEVDGGTGKYDLNNLTYTFDSYSDVYTGETNTSIAYDLDAFIDIEGFTFEYIDVNGMLYYSIADFETAVNDGDITISFGLVIDVYYSRNTGYTITIVIDSTGFNDYNANDQYNYINAKSNELLDENKTYYYNEIVEVTMPSVMDQYTLDGEAVRTINIGNANKTVHVSATPKTYTVTYNYAGNIDGIVSGYTATATYNYENALTFPTGATVTRPNYYLVGWDVSGISNINATGSLGTNFNANYGINPADIKFGLGTGSYGNIEISAVWVPALTAITLNYGYTGNAQPASVYAQYGSSRLYQKTSNTVTDYYLGGVLLQEYDINAISNTVLNRNGYTVSESNVFSRKVGSVIYDLGFITYTRATNTFSYNNSITYDTGLGNTFNLNWEIIKFNITYDFNSTTDYSPITAGEYTGQNADWPTTYNITTPTFELSVQGLPSRPGYTFGGFVIKNLTSDVYNRLNVNNNAQIGDSISSISIGSYGDIEVLALWNLVTYEIHYNLNDADSVSPASYANNYTAPTNFVIETTVLPISSDLENSITTTLSSETALPDDTELLRVGYTFLGWTDNGSAETVKFAKDGNYITTILEGSYGNVSLIANWQVIEYTITYDFNSQYAGGDTVYSEVNSGVEDTWKETFTIEDSFFLCEKTDDSNQTVYGDYPSRTGYTFKGFAITSHDGVVNENSTESFGITKILAGSYGDFDLLAQWELVTYTITYDLNFAETSASHPSYADNYTKPESFVIEKTKLPTGVATELSSEITLPDDTELLRPGYTFLGWTYNGTDNTVKFAKDGNYITTILEGSYGDITFTANWEIIEYTLTYDITSEGFTASPGVEKVKIANDASGNKVQVYDSSATKDYYTIDAGNITYKFNVETPTFDLLSAKNTDKHYNVYYYNNNPYLPFEKDGYYFVGYTADTNEITDETTFITSIPRGTASNITVYARATEKTSTLTVDANGGMMVSFDYDALDADKSGHITDKFSTVVSYNDNIFTESLTGKGKYLNQTEEISLQGALSAMLSQPSGTMFVRSGYTYLGYYVKNGDLKAIVLKYNSASGNFDGIDGQLGIYTYSSVDYNNNPITESITILDNENFVAYSRFSDNLDITFYVNWEQLSYAVELDGNWEYSSDEDDIHNYLPQYNGSDISASKITYDGNEYTLDLGNSTASEVKYVYTETEPEEKTYTITMRVYDNITYGVRLDAAGDTIFTYHTTVTDENGTYSIYLNSDSSPTKALVVMQDGTYSIYEGDNTTPSVASVDTNFISKHGNVVYTLTVDDNTTTIDATNISFNNTAKANVVYGNETSVISNFAKPYTLRGHEFMGLALTKDASKNDVITDFTNIASVQGVAVRLYAVWEAKSYEIQVQLAPEKADYYSTAEKLKVTYSGEGSENVDENYIGQASIQLVKVTYGREFTFDNPADLATNNSSYDKAILTPHRLGYNFTGEFKLDGGNSLVTKISKTSIPANGKVYSISFDNGSWSEIIYKVVLSSNKQNDRNEENFVNVNNAEDKKDSITIENVKASNKTTYKLATVKLDKYDYSDQNVIESVYEGYRIDSLGYNFTGWYLAGNEEAITTISFNAFKKLAKAATKVDDSNYTVTLNAGWEGKRFEIKIALALDTEHNNATPMKLNPNGTQNVSISGKVNSFDKYEINNLTIIDSLKTYSKTNYKDFGIYTGPITVSTSNGNQQWRMYYMSIIVDYGTEYYLPGYYYSTTSDGVMLFNETDPSNRTSPDIINKAGTSFLGYAVGYGESTVTYQGEVISGIISDQNLEDHTYVLYLQTDTYLIEYVLPSGATFNSNANYKTSYQYGETVILPTEDDLSYEADDNSFYSFVGWHNASSGSNETITQINATEVGNKTYVAEFVKSQLTTDSKIVTLESSRGIDISYRLDVQDLSKYATMYKETKQAATKYNLYTLYDVALINSANKIVQPDGEVSMRFLIPEEFRDRENLTVLAIGSDGSYKELTCKVNGDYIEFTTDKITYYAIAELKSSSNSAATIPSYVWIVVASGVFALGAVSLLIYFLKRKKRRII